MLEITISIANRFIRQARSENVSLSYAKLQCLMYLLHRQYLKKTKRILLKEVFIAGINGPRLLSIQTAAYEQHNFDNGTFDYFTNPDGTYSYLDVSKHMQVQYAFLDVWYDYKNCTANDLLKGICKPMSAWQKARNKGNKVLDNIDIYGE